MLNSRLHFLVKWKGYTHDENSWERESYLDCPKKAIAGFYRRPLVAAAAFATLPFQPYKNLTVTPRIAAIWSACATGHRALKG